VSPVKKNYFVLGRRHFLWLAAGAMLALAALTAGVALMGFSARLLAIALVGGVLLAPAALQIAGSARVLLRYAERVVSHEGCSAR